MKIPTTRAAVPTSGTVRTVRAADIHARGYYEPRHGIDAVKLDKARKAMAEGQRDPLQIVVGDDGALEVTDGRHRLRAAVEAGANVRVRFERGASAGKGSDVVLIGGSKKGAATGASDWRSIGDRGAAYPAFIRALDGKSGVYAIRRNGLIFNTVLYVGESHTDNLYKTLTRHFQSWRRGKSWWRGQFAPEQTDPGHTYERESALEVRVQVATKAKALDLQTAWIRTLKPRDNVALVEEEAPF